MTKRTILTQLILFAALTTTAQDRLNTVHRKEELFV